MPLQPWPHRVTFMAPLLRLTPADQPHAVVAAGFLATVLFEHLVRHPVLAATDADDQDLDDGARLLDAEHPRFAEAVQAELSEARRDEVAWFELLLDPAQPPAGRLHVLSAARQRQVFDGASGDGSVSALIDHCLAQWLAARWLPPLPRALEPFSVAELMAAIQAASRIVQAASSAPGVANALLDYQRKLVVPMYRVADAATRIPMDARILKIEPDNPKALLNGFLARRGKGPDELRAQLAKQGLGTPTVAELEQVIQLAPQWGKPHLAMIGDDVPTRKVLHHQGIAATLMPRNVFAVDGYAAALRRAGRPEEAWRISRRCSRLVPKYIPAHISAIVSLRECGRHGEAYLQTHSRRRALADLWKPGQMPPAIDGPMREFVLVVADAAYQIGALDEAARMQWEALAGARVADHERRAAELQGYQADADTLCVAWARDGHYRGDPGRTVVGYGRAGVRADLLDGADTARLLAATTALGREELAPLIFAQHRGAGIKPTPAGRLALARALVLGGDLRAACEQLQIVALDSPQAKLETEANRILRLAGVRFPVADWERVVEERLDAGAARLARQIARDAADFVPGAERSAAIREALGQVPAIAFDRAWLEPLGAALGPSEVRELEHFFLENAQPSLATADKLVNEWPRHVAARQQNDPRAAAQSLYALAQALVRYLAATAGPPSVLGGGYRQVASEALLAVARVGVDWLDESVRPMLAAIEAATTNGLDWWMLDTWLLRLERALELDASLGGHVVRLSQGLRNVSALLRGDERIAFEERMGAELLGFPDAAAQAREMLERGVRAFGSDDAAGAWGEAARRCADPRQALDVLWTASLVAPDGWEAQAALGKALLEAGNGERALEPLARGVALAPADRKAELLAGLRAAWQGAMDVPFSAAEAAAQGTGHLRAARYPAAVRCLRWAHAVEPSAATAKSLGIALGRAGLAEEALALFTQKAGEKEGARQAAQALHESKRDDLAARVQALGTGKLDEEGWALLGRTAQAAGDADTAAEAYGHAYHARDGHLATADLAAYAAALFAVGEWERCEEVAGRLVAAAGSDALHAAAGQHALARARLGQGRAADAVGHAQEAVKLCPIPEVRKEYHATLTLAQKGQAPPMAPRRSAQARERALAALVRGDRGAAQAAATSEQSWAASRAQLVLSCLRGDGETHLPVASAALRLSETLLQATVGQTDAEAAMCRALALEVRELALFAADPLPYLGPQIPRERFEALLADRRR
jgi:hypothetical protein